MPYGDLEELTMGEVAFIRRNRLGLTQECMAELLGMSRDRYRDHENNKNSMYDLMPRRSKWILDSILPHELCILYRRRLGYTQARVAEDLDVSVKHISQMEKDIADCTILVQYYEQ